VVAAGSFGIGRKSRQFLLSQRSANARVSIATEILALGPSCISSTPPLKREWSAWPKFGWIPANLHDFSKGARGLALEQCALDAQVGLLVAVVQVKSEDCWIFSPAPHPLRVAF
jgi:hypothetical protein